MIIQAADRARSDLAALQLSIERALGSLPLRLTVKAATPYLEIGGHQPIARPAMLAVRRLLGVRRLRKVYEETTTVVLSHLIGLLGPRQFFDIGAGQGHFARVAASHMTSPPRVHAFEMHPERFASLQERLAGCSYAARITAHQSALSERHKGVITTWMSRSLLFEVPPKIEEYREAWHRRLKFRLQGNNKRGLISARVMVTSLDRFVASTGAVPDMLKIDVDGYEMSVLRGAGATLARHRPVILLELHSDKKLRFGATRRKVVEHLLALGYEALFFTNHHDRAACQAVEMDADSPILDRQEASLLLFMHPNSCALRRLNVVAETSAAHAAA
jgi:FkbM family methyltransferase